MKNTEPEKHDLSLHKVLKEWRIDGPLPSRFQEAVWQRIECREVQGGPSGWGVIVRWIGAVLPRPALAASYLSILLAIGLTAGWAQGRQETARIKSELGERYIRVLDPYQAPRQ